MSNDDKLSALEILKKMSALKTDNMTVFNTSVSCGGLRLAHINLEWVYQDGRHTKPVKVSVPAFSERAVDIDRAIYDASRNIGAKEERSSLVNIHDRLPNPGDVVECLTKRGLVRAIYWPLDPSIPRFVKCSTNHPLAPEIEINPLYWRNIRDEC